MSTFQITYHDSMFSIISPRSTARKRCSVDVGPLVPQMLFELSYQSAIGPIRSRYWPGASAKSPGLSISMYCLGDVSASVVSLISRAVLVFQTENDPGRELLEIGSGYSTRWASIILYLYTPGFAHFAASSCWFMSRIFGLQIISNFA
jgi:hypothetical protein